MLAAQGRNPNVIGRNWGSGELQFGTDRAIGNGGSFVDVQNAKPSHAFRQPSFVLNAVAGLRNPVTKFAQDDDRKRELCLPGQDRFKSVVPIRQR